MKILSLLCLLSVILFFESCDPFESVKKEELPPATQEGKNTFGCLVNGKVWLPKGNAGGVSGSLDASYDSMQAGGTFDILAHRILSDIDRNYIYIYMTNLRAAGEYDLCCEQVGTALFDYSQDCNFDRDTLVHRAGRLVITKFDHSNRIASGTFEFTLFKSNRDTLYVTDCRFDMKF